MAVNGKTLIYGLIGDPVEHTLSPLIHNLLAEKMGVNMVYVPFPTAKAGLAAAVQGAFALGIRGLNVTVPHKSAVIPGLQQVDRMATEIGAVNTLVRVGNGYHGFNTDMAGLYRALQSEGIGVAEEEILLLGAGGAARAAAFMCAYHNAATLTILNRSVEKAISLAAEVNRVAGRNFAVGMALTDFEKLPHRKFLALQGTSVGLYPDVDKAVINEPAFYERIHTGYEMIYNPEQTSFMKLVRAAGGNAYNGLKMLLYQAVLAFERWHQLTVSEPVAAQVYCALTDALTKRNNIILIGFMGSGKTTVGQHLAARLVTDFIDTDRLIAQKEGRTVAEIFAAQGETYFRERETACLTELLKIEAQERGRVIAVGGGLPLKEANRLLLKQLGKVIYLKTSVPEICARLQGDRTRPLLQTENPAERVEGLLTMRHPIYEAIADFVLDTTNRMPKEIAAILEAMLE